MFFLSDDYDIDQLTMPYNTTQARIDAMTDEEFREFAAAAKPLLDELLPSDMNSPYLLDEIYYTYRRDDPSSTLAAAQATPEFFIYYSQNKREARIFTDNIKMHRHNFYEFMYVIDGSIYQNIENSMHLYTAGSCCLMNKNIHHREVYDEYHRIVFLKISDDLISYILSAPPLKSSGRSLRYETISAFLGSDPGSADSSNRSYIDFIPSCNDPESCGSIYDCLERINEELQLKDKASVHKIIFYLTQILDTLCDESLYSTTPIQVGTEAQRELFEEISAYIRQKKGRTSRSDLENVFNYSGDYIYRIIGKYTGLSISEYCMQVRLENAACLLRETNLSVQQICAELGFTNTTQFYKAFKDRYDMTPKKYR